MEKAGIEIYNDDRKLVINERYMNLRLTRKVKLHDLKQVYHGNDAYGIGTRAWKMPLNSGELVCAIGMWKGPDGMRHMGISQLKKGNTMFFVDCKASSVFEYGQGASQSVGNILGFDKYNPTIYVFGDGEGKATGKYGLQVFDENGKCVFDSNYNYIRVLKNGIASVYEADNANSDIPTNKEVAICGLGIKVYDINRYVPLKHIQDEEIHLYGKQLITGVGVRNNRITAFTQDIGGYLPHYALGTYPRVETLPYTLIDVTGI